MKQLRGININILTVNDLSSFDANIKTPVINAVGSVKEGYVRM